MDLWTPMLILFFIAVMNGVIAHYRISELRDDIKHIGDDAIDRCCYCKQAHPELTCLHCDGYVHAKCAVSHIAKTITENTESQ
jgi:hypothetical protein